MQNKYYTPTPEELFIGYELEYYSGHGSRAFDGYNVGTDRERPEYWKKKILDLDVYTAWDRDGMESFYNEIEDLNRGHYRTKFLDQQDIIGEGWAFTGRGVDLWFEREYPIDMGSWTSYKAVFQYGTHDHRLVIKALDPGSEDVTMFRGECKSINELRKIMQWLKIK